MYNVKNMHSSKFAFREGNGDIIYSRNVNDFHPTCVVAYHGSHNDGEDISCLMDEESCVDHQQPDIERK